MKREIENKIERKKIILSGLSFVFATFCLALCYNLFFVPNNIVVGGMSGLALIINKLTGLNTQIFIYASSFILLVISFSFLGKDNTERAVIGTFLYPMFVTFTNPIAKFLLKYLVFKEILVTVFLASMFYGFSNGIIYKFGYSTGGSDVLVKLGCKYLHWSEGKGVLIINVFIILFGGLTFGIDTAVYALIILFINSLIIDKITLGISNCKKFMIYTKKSVKVKKIIADEFKTGYTIFPTVGGYSHTKGVMIMCVIRNKDVNFFKQKILEVDPTSFFVIDDCYEVQGGVKRSNLPFM